MKKIIALFAFCFAVSLCFGQIKAVTETGDEVILKEDGTWEYVGEISEMIENEPLTNPTPFEKNEDATFLLKSTKTKIGLWLIPKDWTFKKSAMNPLAEYEIHNNAGDIYGMLISEKIELPLETLKAAAITNAKAAAPDLKVLHEEFRTVNGLKVLNMQFEGTVQGIKLTYFGTYYSDSSGTVQVLTWTAQNIFQDKKAEMEDFLNGICTFE